MEQEEAVNLIKSLSGNEHDWVDFKQDYDIGGISKHKAEFAKDVSSLANTLTQEPERYLIIGCDDDGKIVGIDDSRIVYRGEGPRHIFSYDESDIQQILDGLLDPLPDLSWYTFEQNGAKFGILIVSGSGPRPIIIDRDLYDNNNNQFLTEGQIYVRRGSSKEIAKNNYLNRIIDQRVTDRRDEILDGISKAIEVGPEAISRFKGLIQSDDDRDALPIKIDEDAEYSFKERVSREPASGLDSYLNSDIVDWKYRKEGFAHARSLWKYYSRSDELTLDEDGLYFLTQSSIDNHLMGFFWLIKSENPVQILRDTPDKVTHLKYAARALTLLGESEHLNSLISDSKYGYLDEIKTCQGKVDHVMHNRVNYLLNSKEHNLRHSDWKRDFRPKEMTADEAKSEIPAVANQLHNVQKIMDDDYSAAVSLRNEFRDALWDLEVILGKELASR